MTTLLDPKNNYSLPCPAIGIDLLKFDLFRDLQHAEQALCCFEMRDADTPEVRLGEEMALHMLEMRKADRTFERLPPSLATWLT